MRSFSLPRIAACAVVSLAVLGAARTASADGPHLTGSGAIHVGVSFGPKIKFIVGIDLRLTGRLNDNFQACQPKPRPGVGPFLQIGLWGLDGLQLAAGAHAGSDVYRQMLAAEGELGWTLRLLPRGGKIDHQGLHLGALPSFFPSSRPAIAPAIELPVRVIVPLVGEQRTPEVTTALGLRFPPLFGMPPGCE